MNKPYRKHHSFTGFSGAGSDVAVQLARALAAMKVSLVTASQSDNLAPVLKRAHAALQEEESSFEITQFIADEMAMLNEGELVEYLYHRYRYDIFPQTLYKNGFGNRFNYSVLSTGFRSPKQCIIRLWRR